MNDENLNSKSSSSEIAYVEAHDAQIGRVIILGGGKGVIEFTHISIYLQTEPDRYDIWSYRAELQMEGISRFEMEGPLDMDDFVSDGKLFSPEGKEADWMSLLNGEEAKSLELIMTSGTAFRVNIQSVVLNLIAPIEKIEEWTGPL